MIKDKTSFRLSFDVMDCDPKELTPQFFDSICDRIADQIEKETGKAISYQAGISPTLATPGEQEKKLADYNRSHYPFSSGMTEKEASGINGGKITSGYSSGYLRKLSNHISDVVNRDND